jgi:hypothetical protein
MLANHVHVDDSCMLANLSAAFAKLAVFSNMDADDELQIIGKRLCLADEFSSRRLGPPAGVRYCAAAAAYAPGAAVSATQLIKDCCDHIHWFDKPNDLIVRCEDVWSCESIRENRNFWRNVPSLMIEPEEKTLYGSNHCQYLGTPLLKRRQQNGIHHLNLLSNEHCQQFILENLFT